MTKIAWSGSGSESISQSRGSKDPDTDPPQNVMDPQHCLELTLWKKVLSWNRCTVTSNILSHLPHRKTGAVVIYNRNPFEIYRMIDVLIRKDIWTYGVRIRDMSIRFRLGGSIRGPYHRIMEPNPALFFQWLSSFKMPSEIRCFATIVLLFALQYNC